MLREIGTVVASARKRLNLSVESLAKHASVETSTLVALEKGTPGITTTEMGRVAEQLELGPRGIAVGAQCAASQEQCISASPRAAGLRLQVRDHSRQCPRRGQVASVSERFAADYPNAAPVILNADDEQRRSNPHLDRVHLAHELAHVTLGIAPARSAGCPAGAIVTTLPASGAPSIVLMERVGRAHGDGIITDGQARVALRLSVDEPLPWI